MKASTALFIAGMILAASSFVGSHSDITTFHDLVKLQNLFGLLGVMAGTVMAWFGKSPASGEGLVAKITGNGTTPTPPVG